MALVTIFYSRRGVIWDLTYRKADLELYTVPPARALGQSGQARTALGAAVWGTFQALARHPWSGKALL